MNIEKPQRFDYEQSDNLVSPELEKTPDLKTMNNDQHIDDEGMKDYIKKMKRESSKLEHYIKSSEMTSAKRKYNKHLKNHRTSISTRSVLKTSKSTNYIEKK